MALSGLALASKDWRKDSELSERDKLSSEGEEQRALQRELLTVDIHTLLGMYIYFALVDARG